MNNHCKNNSNQDSKEDNELSGKYLHYKGHEYIILGIAHHSETLEELIIYQGLYTDPEFGKNPIWARPKHMFFDNVIVDGKTVPRFKKIS